LTWLTLAALWLGAFQLGVAQVPTVVGLLIATLGTAAQSWFRYPIPNWVVYVVVPILIAMTLLLSLPKIR